MIAAGYNRAMAELALRLLPIFLLFALGMVLRLRGVVGPAGADRILRWVVNVGLPSLVLVTVSATHLDRDLVLLPLCAGMTVLATFPVVARVAGRLGLERRSQGVVVIGTMIMNMAAEYPLVLAAWGKEGVGRFALFDLGNAAVVLTVVYALACRYGGHAARWNRMLRRMAAFPPLWALGAALALNLGGVALPRVLAEILELVGGGLVLLLMVALGVHFRARLALPGATAWTIGLRLGLGGLLGLAWVTLFGLSGLDRRVVLLGTLAPVGFNTLVFAAREGLDRRLAATIVSLSLVLALLYLPLVLLAMS